MLEVPLLLIVIIVIALVFDYTNGANDAANSIATIVSTKVLPPVTAVTMAAALNLIGAFLGTKVAETMGEGIVTPEMVLGCRTLILAALIGAILWNITTWMWGIPSSSSHALIGGFIGAALAHAGWGVLNYQSIIEKVVIPLFLSPVIGFTVGFVLMRFLAMFFANARPRAANGVFRRLQIGSSAFMAVSHGMNDAQKTMGLITLALLIFGRIPEFHVPFWVRFLCSGAMFMGTMTGGWKIVKTMGHKIFKLEPVHGFAAETSAAGVIATASMMGAPVSTTHVISSSVLGVGASKRLSAVRWGIAGRLVIAWVITIPISACVGALSFTTIELIQKWVQ